MFKKISFRIISYVLVICMLMSSVPGVAVAKDNRVLAEVTSESADVLQEEDSSIQEEPIENSESEKDSSEQNNIIGSSEPTEDIDLETLYEEVEYISDQELEKFAPVVELSDEQYMDETDNSDGTKTLEVYTTPIKCENDKGQLAEIESDLVLSNDPDYTYESKNTPVTVQIADNLKNSSAFRASYGNYTVGFTPINLKKKNNKPITQKELIKEEIKTLKGKVKNTNKALKFNKTFDDDISIEVEPKAFGMKDNIVLNKKPLQKEFSYEMSVYGAVPFLQEDGSVVVLDKENKKLIGTMEAPFMTDSSANQKVSYDIQVRLFHLSENKYIYTIVPDHEFLENSKTIYPVVIDPDYTFSDLERTENGFRHGTGDTFTRQNDSTAYNDRKYMLVGKDSTGTYRSYVKFLDVCTHIGKNSTINSASFEMYADTSIKPTVSPLNVTIATTAQSLGAYECTENPLMADITGTSHPATISTATATSSPNPAGDGWYKWDITTLVQKWSNNGNASRIVQVKHTNESTSNTLKCFHTKGSADKTKTPRLVVNYTPNGTVMLSTPTTWQKNRVNATISWTNIAPEGTISELQYHFGEAKNADGSTIWVTLKNADGSKIVSPNGSNVSIPASTAVDGGHRIYLRAKHFNGQYFVNTASDVTYKLDTVEPSLPASVSVIENSDSLTVNFSAATDPNPYNMNNVSGIARYEYTVSTSGTTAPTSGYVAITNGGKLIPKVQRGYIWVRAVDAAGNIGPAKASAPYELSSIKRFYGIPGVYAPTGNFSESSEDINIQTVLGDVSLSRTYNSLEYGAASIFGNGFTFNYAMKVISSANKAIVIMPNSAQWQFDKNIANQYEASDNRGALTVVGNEFRLKTLDMTEYGFNTSGYLKYVKDSDGNQLNITTDSSGKVTGITDIIGTDIQFTYSGSLLTKITDSKSGKAVHYTYSGNNLMKVSYPDGLEKHYEYTSGRLSSITESGSNKANPIKIVDLTYYTSGTYTGMVNVAMDTIGVKTTYSYDFANQTVTLTDSYSGNTSVREIRKTYNGNLAILKIEDLKQSSQKIQETVFESNVADPERPSSTTDKYGNITKYDYDGRGNLIKTTFPDSSTEISEYDNDNHLIKFTDRIGLVTEYAYENGLLTQTKCGGYITASYTYYPETTYNVFGLVKTKTDQHNNTTTYEYDAEGNVIKDTQRIDGVDRITTNTYDSKNQLIKTIDPNGVCTENYYNSLGQNLLVTVQDKNGSNIQSTRTVYDVLGRVVQEINPIDYNPTKSNLDNDSYNDKTVGTRTEYNDIGQIQSKTDPMGNKTSYVYDNDGNLQKETLPNGSYETFTYDDQGRVTSESFYDHTTSATTKVQDISYTTNKDETKTTDYLASGLTAVTTEEYNWEGQLIKKTNDNGSTQTNTYAKGLLTKENHSLNHWTSYTYDTWGRVLTKAGSFDSSGDSKTTYTYDVYGNVKTESVKSNATGQTETSTKKEFEYDSQNKQIKTIYYEGSNPISYVQSYYSWDGKLLREYKNLSKPIIITGLDHVQNPNNQDYSVIKYEYDAMGRLASKTDALNRVETYNYDKENRQTYKEDPNGTEHTTEYDRNDNPIKKTSGGIIKTYTYDKMGNTLTEREGSITTSYTYDGHDNCLTETTGDTVKNFTYNYAGMLTNQTITVGGSQKQNITKTYDKMGNLSTVSENGSQKANYTYDLLGRLTKTTNANGTIEENTYNLAGLVTSTVNKKGTMVLSQYDYTYYYDGNQETKTDNSGTTSYIYDGRGQLVKSFKNGGNTAPDSTLFENAMIPLQIDSLLQEYTYDANGNRTKFKETKNGTAKETNYNYNKNDQLLSETTGDTTISYVYDKNGNMTSKSDGITQSFDTLNRMTSYVKSGTTTTYTYYPDDMRKSKKIGTAVATEHIWNNGNIALDMNGVTVTSSYIYGNNLITSAYGWYLYNAHRDVVSLTDSNGNITHNYDYDPFGNRLDTATGTDNNPYRYCGEYFDVESGYTYLSVRYLDPSIGRFISEDPATAGSNWYTYCNNDPVNYIDPDGLDAIVVTDSTAALYYGHTSVVAQDSDGTWWYFFWGHKNAKLVKIPSANLSSLTSLNTWLKLQGANQVNSTATLQNTCFNYNFATYIEGDFNATVNYYRSLVKSAKMRYSYNTQKKTHNYKNKSYSLFTNNCVQKSNEGLRKGTLPGGTSAGSIIPSISLIPNNYRDTIGYLFLNFSMTKSGARAIIKNLKYTNSYIYKYNTVGQKYTIMLGI